MSGQATGWVLRHGPQDRLLRSVLIVIADAANRDGEHAHPGMAAMVEGSLYSRPTVFRALAQLERDGWVTVESRGGGRGKANVFTIPGVLGNGLTMRPFPDGNGLMEDPKGSHLDRERVSSGDAESDPLYTAHEKPLEASTVKSSTVKLNDAREDSTLGLTSQCLEPRDGFDEFWDLYPRKVAKGRARATWRWALGVTTADVILASVDDYARSRAGKDPEFTKHPATWLRGECWSDASTEPDDEPEESYFDRQARWEREAAAARRVAAQ